MERHSNNEDVGFKRDMNKVAKVEEGIINPIKQLQREIAMIQHSNMTMREEINNKRIKTEELIKATAQTDQRAKEAESQYENLGKYCETLKQTKENLVKTRNEKLKVYEIKKKEAEEKIAELSATALKAKEDCKKKVEWYTEVKYPRLELYHEHKTLKKQLEDSREYHRSLESELKKVQADVFKLKCERSRRAKEESHFYPLENFVVSLAEMKVKTKEYEDNIKHIAQEKTRKADKLKTLKDELSRMQAAPDPPAQDNFGEEDIVPDTSKNKAIEEKHSKFPSLRFNLPKFTPQSPSKASREPLKLVSFPNVRIKKPAFSSLWNTKGQGIVVPYIKQTSGKEQRDAAATESNEKEANAGIKEPCTRDLIPKTVPQWKGIKFPKVTQAISPYFQAKGSPNKASSVPYLALKSPALPKVKSMFMKNPNVSSYKNLGDSNGSENVHERDSTKYGSPCGYNSGNAQTATSTAVALGEKNTSSLHVVSSDNCSSKRDVSSSNKVGLYHPKPGAVDNVLPSQSEDCVEIPSTPVSTEPSHGDLDELNETNLAFLEKRRKDSIPAQEPNFQSEPHEKNIGKSSQTSQIMSIVTSLSQPIESPDAEPESQKHPRTVLLKDAVLSHHRMPDPSSESQTEYFTPCSQKSSCSDILSGRSSKGTSPNTKTIVSPFNLEKYENRTKELKEFPVSPEMEYNSRRAYNPDNLSKDQNTGRTTQQPHLPQSLQDLMQLGITSPEDNSIPDGEMMFNYDLLKSPTHESTEETGMFTSRAKTAEGSSEKQGGSFLDLFGASTGNVQQPASDFTFNFKHF